MNAPCDHHKTCGDCFSPNQVRTLEATVENLAADFAYATECNLATLDELIFLKSSSKSRIRRQRDICLKMLGQCQSIAGHINWGNTWQCKYPRVKKILDAAKTNPNGLSGTAILPAAFEQWISEHLKP